jgi:4-amino-4-deoxy-L-arabinose transferase-like glycosyltransferase
MTDTLGPERIGQRIPLVVAVAVVVRLLLAASAWTVTQDPARFLTADSGQYLRLAGSLAFDHRFERANGPELYRPPGYPAFLAPGVLIGHPVIIAIALQALLGGVLVWLVWLIARRLFEPRTAFLCALLAALEPGLIVWSNTIMAETLLSVWVTAIGFALVVHLDEGRLRWAATAGAATAAAAYVKPVAYFLPLWIAATLTAFGARGSSRANRMKSAAVFLITAVVLLAPWQIRNGVVGGYWGFSTQAEGMLSSSLPASVSAIDNGRTFLNERSRYDQYRNTGPVSAPSYADARRRGVALILASPLIYARIHVAGMIRTLIDPGALPYLDLFGLRTGWAGIARVVNDRGAIAGLVQAARDDRLVFWSVSVMFVISIGYLLPAIAGVWIWRGHWSAPHLVLASVVVYFVLVSGGPWGQSRFRQPIMPVISVLAGYSMLRRR